MRKGHAAVISRDKRSVTSAEEAQMQDGDAGDMAVGFAVV
jgi:hypothetical protein